MDKPTILDLFCGAGGAAKGYHDAGFDVIGVDNTPMPRYPFRFIQADALDFVHDLLSECNSLMRLSGISAIHASPPCQEYSTLVTQGCTPGRIQRYPKLIEPIRALLLETGLPYVIENVQGSPLINPVMLCGSHFGLETFWPGVGRVGLRRHRLFESSIPIPDPGPHDHSLMSVRVYGGGMNRGPGHAQAKRQVMRIDWMNSRELNESIPPAFTEYVGNYVMTEIRSRNLALAA